MSATRGLVIVAGATGYVGSRLVPRLLAAGWRVRAAGRSLAKLQARSWATDANVELAQADASDAASLERALSGCDAAYYLIHSMASGRGFEQADAAAARAFASAAARARVGRILYLGGLGDEATRALSPHLRSRQEVGRILASQSVPVTELRAGVILGSGSASFEILRYLTDRLPIMITPRWVSTAAQPIAIRDVLGYLVGCLDEPRTTGRVFEIGGSEVVSYRRLMEIYAEEAKLRRRIVIPVPVLTPRLSSYWIHLVTPAPASLARPLAEGLRNPVLVRDESIRTLLPRDLLTPREAIRLAIDPAQRERMESHWTDAYGRAPAAWGQPGDEAWTGGTVLTDARVVRVDALPEAVWDRVERIGGERGYYGADFLWHARGFLDKLAGGVGSMRGRAHASTLRIGDALDFWRVGDVEPGRRVRLVAEMKLPGRAFLELEVTPDGTRSRLRQTATFVPHGVAGLAYWYLLLPIHRYVFRKMLAGIARAAQRPAPPRRSDPAPRAP